MILNVLLFILIGISIYLILDKLIANDIFNKFNSYMIYKNEKYYENLLRYYDKNKKIKVKENINYIYKINVLIERCNLKRSLLINPLTFAIIGVLMVTLSYLLAFEFLKLAILSLLISLPVFFLPFVLLNMIAEYKESKIEKVFLNFLLQLKNYTKINNDIVEAMREVKTIEPLQGYIRKFLLEISSGIRFEKAIDNFRGKINIKQIKMFLTNIEHCYLYGGNFSMIIDKSYDTICEIQHEKARRSEETKSARIVLFILVFLDILVYISFIKSNEENYFIMRKSIIGNFILYWNFISMWILVWISGRVKKLDY